MTSALGNHGNANARRYLKEILKTKAGADKWELKFSDSEITIETQTHSISCWPFVGFVIGSDHELVLPTCLANYNLYNLPTYLQRRLKLFAKASGIVGIQCTVGPNWPPLCARRSVRCQHTATDALPIVLNRRSLVVHTQSEHNSAWWQCREPWKCRRRRSSRIGCWATWPPGRLSSKQPQAPI